MTTLLSKQEQRELLRAGRAGDAAARHRLIQANIRLVHHYVHNLCRQHEHWPREDLASAGMIGLCEAFDLFDLDRDIKFSTFASWCIRGRVLSCLGDWLDHARHCRPLSAPERGVHNKKKPGKFIDESTSRAVEECVDRLLARELLDEMPALARQIAEALFGFNGPAASKDELDAEFGVSRQYRDQVLREGIHTARRRLHSKMMRRRSA